MLLRIASFASMIVVLVVVVFATDLLVTNDLSYLFGFGEIDRKLTLRSSCIEVCPSLFHQTFRDGNVAG